MTPRPAVVLLTPGLHEDAVWGERVVAESMRTALEHEMEGATVHVLGLEDRSRLEQLSIDLLISAYTGPRQPRRWDEVGSLVDAISILMVSNQADGMAEEFGDAVVTTEGGEALREALRWLLVEPAERVRRASIGRDLVLQRSTYAHWARRVHRFAVDLWDARANAGGRRRALPEAVPA